MEYEPRPGEPAIEFPPEPPENADVPEVMAYVVATINEVIKTTVPLSPRMKVLVSLQRVADQARTIYERVQAGGLPLHNLAAILQIRDLARGEQRWIDEWLREAELEPSVLDAIHYYKVRLAQVEAAQMMAIAYVGTDREADPDTGEWWAQHAGAATAGLMEVLPVAMELPEDADWYQRRKEEVAGQRRGG